jgi:hypothetical protein
MSQPPNQTSFRRGISGNPGGRPATAEVSALARRYTADWLRGLVEVVRLPVCKENAPSIISAAIALRDTGYPGLTKSAPDAGPASLHLHLLAVTADVQAAAVTAQVQATLMQTPAPTSDLVGSPWELLEGDLHEPALTEDYVPPPDERLPHEALPLWDAAAGSGPSAGADHETDRNNDPSRQGGWGEETGADDRGG